MTDRSAPPTDTRGAGDLAGQKHIEDRWIVSLIVAVVGLAAAIGFYHLSQTGTQAEIAAATAWADFMVAVTAAVAIWVSLRERAPPADPGAIAVLQWLQAHSAGPELPRETGVPAGPPDTPPPDSESTSTQEDDRPPA